MEAALRLENALGAKEIVTESIAHTAYYSFADGYECELGKFDFTFQALKGSDNLDEHIDQLFDQMPAQCAARGWDSWYQLDEDVFCYLEKDPRWVDMYTSDEKLRLGSYEHINCLAGQ